MVVGLLLIVLALRSGLAIRRRRSRSLPPQAKLRKEHLKFAKPAVTMVCLGFLAGPTSAIWLRDWEAFGTLHGVLGLLAACSFVVAAVLGHRLESGAESRELHAWAGLCGFLAAAVAAVAGFVLLP